MKCNVDQLKLIQLCITLFDGSGTLPKGVHLAVQLFKFNLMMEDMYAEESINLLKDPVWISTSTVHGKSTCSGLWRDVFISSGLVLMENVT